ncbi:hypothetical protein D9757_000014 [Collybiopsis confluens]|uniref:NACHT domain-containing protein n=1 Tax=Collybiopsis confluens TaxID=2823264 RepID=A0A8H5I244_9AGAR|nr:hypothetical protein D9757_000014 [Collybiopsis confluens]
MPFLLQSEPGDKSSQSAPDGDLSKYQGMRPIVRLDEEQASLPSLRPLPNAAQRMVPWSGASSSGAVILRVIIPASYSPSQLAISMPELRPVINSVVLDDTSILTLSMESQFDRLIIQPCLKAQLEKEEQSLSLERHAHSNLFLMASCKVLIIDGLDECLNAHDQVRILSVTGYAMQRRLLPFRLLISSRSEPRIKEAFQRPHFEHTCLWTGLDDNLQASRDIRIFFGK